MARQLGRCVSCVSAGSANSLLVLDVDGEVAATSANSDLALGVEVEVGAKAAAALVSVALPLHVLHV